MSNLKRGRPRKTELNEARPFRVPLNTRVTVAMRIRIEEAASRSGRSIGQEVELQLEIALAIALHSQKEKANFD
jgi:hypothetical protein